MQQEMTSSLERDLEREMGEGEELLWFNRPASSRRSSSGSTSVFIILAIVFGSIGIALLATAIIITLVAVENRAASIVSTVFYIISSTFLFLTLFFGLFAIFYRPHLKGTVYAITNQRVIILKTGSVLTVDSYARNDINYITRRERADGYGDLIFTGPRSPYSYNYNYGNYGYNYNYGGYGSSDSGRFLNVPDVRGAEQILRRVFKQEP